MEQLNQFVINHWQLWLAFFVLLIIIFINEFISQKKKAKEVSAQAAVNLINDEDAVIIDLREKELFKKGHIIDSLNVKPEDFELPKMKQYKNKKIILVCVRGQQSPTIAAKLQSLGFDPLVLKGGLAAWESADLPLIKSKG